MLHRTIFLSIGVVVIIGFQIQSITADDVVLRGKRQSQDLEDTNCPDSNLIAPCTCRLNRTSFRTYPELSCVNNSGNMTIDLNYIFRNASQYHDEHNETMVYQRLLLVNSNVPTLNRSIFHGLVFQSMEIYEYNLTSISVDTFEDMTDSLVYILFKGSRMSDTVFEAIKNVYVLRYLVLNLGLRSFNVVPSNALQYLPNLRLVIINGVVNTLKSSAFTSLPILRSLKITNMLETIEEFAFDFNDSEEITNISINLADNRLSESSFHINFTRLRPHVYIDLDLSSNNIRYLPEDTFKEFFTVNNGNTLNIRENKLECGLCESYWIIENRDLLKNRIQVQCDLSQQISFWNFDWSHCDTRYSSAQSATINILTLAFFTLAQYLFCQLYC